MRLFDILSAIKAIASRPIGMAIVILVAFGGLFSLAKLTSWVRAELRAVESSKLQEEKAEKARQEQIETSISPVNPTLHEITNRSFAFFKGTNAIIGYVRGSDNRIELLSQPQGTHRVTGESIRPVTPEIVAQYQNALEEETRKEGDRLKRLDEAKQAKAKVDRSAAEKEVAAHAKAAKVAAVAEAEAEKRKHIARNLRSTETFRTPGLLAVAVAVANPEGQLDESLAAQLASLLPPARVNATGGLFTPAFVADGMLHKLLASGNSELVRLGLPTLTDYLLLGTYRVQFSTNTQFGGFVTASLQFDASVLKSATGVVQEKISDTMSGAGVDTEKAESAAKERLIKSLSTRPWRFLAQ